MLEGLFGNKSAEKVLLHIFHHGESYAAAIANDFKTALNPIKQQLLRFEGAGILVAKDAGKMRFYSFNPKSPLAGHVKEIVKMTYDSIPLDDREKMFSKRRRPRRKGKPVR